MISVPSSPHGHGIAKRTVLRRCLVHLHVVRAQIRCTAQRVLIRAFHQAVDSGKRIALVGLVKLGEPPLVLAVDHALLDAVIQIGHLAHLGARAFNPHPIALLDAQLGGVGRIDLAARRRPQLTAPRQLTMFAVEVHGDATASGHKERPLLGNARLRQLRLRRGLPVRQLHVGTPACTSR